jgi:transposase-like protein
MKTENTKPVVTKWRTIKIKVPVCPLCGSNMEHECAIQSQDIWKYRCTNKNCTYKY